MQMIMNFAAICSRSKSHKFSHSFTTFTPSRAQTEREPLRCVFMMQFERCPTIIHSQKAPPSLNVYTCNAVYVYKIAWKMAFDLAHNFS